MGQLSVKQLIEPKEKASYNHYLINDLKALALMLKNDMIEKSPIRIGAEQEFCIVSNDFYPSNKSETVLNKINNDHFTTEIGTYNLEINSDPLKLQNNCFSELYKQLKTFLKQTETAASAHNLKIILTGILPTLHAKHISNKFMTNKPRYHVLNNALKAIRGENFNIHIKGVDELNIKNDSVMLEACNTSFQTHLQINPNEFVDKYNWAQAIAGPVMASCTNSPLLFGKELWAETRIALFTQSIDTRSNATVPSEIQPRVCFGNNWESGTVVDIFKDNISRFPSLLSASTHTNSLDELKTGIIPKLKALNLHNGTVYKWNRVCYGVGNGKPHLRIECRYIPAGPTLKDEIATMAFWVGLMLGQPKAYENISEKMDFKDAKNNFFKACRNGMESQFVWNNTLISAKDAILNIFLPIAYNGLKKAQIKQSDINTYLGIITKRMLSKNGSQWIVANYRNLLKTKSNFEALQHITNYMHQNQLSNKPVHKWDTILKTTKTNKKRMVKHNMKTNMIFADEKESLELVYHIMKWKKIHHMPIINNEKELKGILSWTDIIKLNGEKLNYSIKDIMTKNVITISQEAPLNQAKKLMSKHSISCLPVTQNNALLGILTTNDFL